MPGHRATFMQLHDQLSCTSSTHLKVELVCQIVGGFERRMECSQQGHTEAAASLQCTPSHACVPRERYPRVSPAMRPLPSTTSTTATAYPISVDGLSGSAMQGWGLTVAIDRIGRAGHTPRETVQSTVKNVVCCAASLSTACHAVKECTGCSI